MLKSKYVKIAIAVTVVVAALAAAYRFRQQIRSLKILESYGFKS